MKIICVIPARYNSKRYPGKALAEIAGFPMIQWVYLRAKNAHCFERILIATDDERISAAAEKFGATAIMTPFDISSGTDRVAYVAKDFKADIYVNLQGDEPLVSPRLLESVCQPYVNKTVRMTTAVKKIQTLNELTDPNLVRVVIDSNGDAIYFSRAVIPYLRDFEKTTAWLDNHTYYKHVGIYTYRRDFLLKFNAMADSALERAEKLEQLRVLENGYKIRTVITNYESRSIDTPEDLISVEKYIMSKNIKVDTIHEEL